MADPTPLTVAELAAIERWARKQVNARQILRLIAEVRLHRMRPAGWGDALLSRFLDYARHNVLATAANLGTLWQPLVETDRLLEQHMARIGSTVDALGEWALVPAILLGRGHSAYRSAVHLAMSAQLPEAYMVLRGSLECALYAAFMGRNIDRQARWLSRENGDAERKAVKREFRPSAMLTHLTAIDAMLGAEADQLYNLTIDLGAHPNELGFLSVTGYEQDDTRHQFSAKYFAAGGRAHSLCLSTTARAGVWLSRIMALLFPQ